MALSESGGTIRRRTAYYQNLREYECSNQTSGIHGTIGRTSLARSLVRSIVVAGSRGTATCSLALDARDVAYQPGSRLMPKFPLRGNHRENRNS